MENRKMMKKGLMLACCLGLFSTVDFNAAETGTSIDRCEQITYMDSNTDYFLNSDIDCGGLTVYSTSSYNGNFDGNGYTISNFSTSGPIIGTVNSGATVSNITFENARVKSRGDNPAGLVAGTNKGTITGINVINSELDADMNVGAIAGNNYGLISNVVVSGTEIESDEDDAGGVVGHNIGVIENASFENGSMVTGRQHVGGISGLQSKEGTINQSTVTGNKTVVKGTNYVGGVVGDSHGSINNTTVDGIKMRINTNLIEFKEQYNFGGFVGKNQDAGYINGSTVINMDMDIDGDIIGGFVGQNDGLIENSLVESSVISGNEKVGGFAGNNYGDIYASTVNNTSVNGGFTVGGFIAFDDEYSKKNRVTNSEVHGNKFVGGYLGTTASDTVVKKSFVDNTNVSGKSYVGGFVGHAYKSDIYDSFANSNVTGDNYIGGFAGEVGANSNIEQTYSAGTVKANYSNAGGFAGNLYDNPNVKYSFTTSDVSGYDKVGAFSGDKHKRADVRKVYYYDNAIVESANGIYTNKDYDSVSADSLASTNFYKDTLQFETDRWDLNAPVRVDSLPQLLI